MPVAPSPTDACAHEFSSQSSRSHHFKVVMMSRNSSTSTHSGPSPLWTSVKDAWPEPEDALVFKRSGPVSGDHENWLGVVRGLCQGQEVPILVLAGDNDDITLAPMLENGVDLSDHVTHWAPWPKADLAMPSAMGAGAYGWASQVPAAATQCRRCQRLANR